MHLGLRDPDSREPMRRWAVASEMISSFMAAEERAGRGQNQ